ncbi:hypothetical protein BDR04DRAFT_1119759 [Suillus decipiens]|nr:hypothetical protein BDR04DRAFT_1119759 [Suillus decipiens]
MTLNSFWRYIVLTFPIVTILTGYVLMLIINLWRSSDVAAVVLVSPAFIPASGIFPSRPTGNSYLLLLAAILTIMYAYPGLQTNEDPLLQYIKYTFLTFAGIVLIIELAYKMYLEDTEVEGDLEGDPLEGGSLEKGSLETVV